MAIAMTINHGEGKGISLIDDSCVVKTQEEVDKILENCCKLYIQSELQKHYQQQNGNQDKAVDA